MVKQQPELQRAVLQATKLEPSNLLDMIFADLGGWPVAYSSLADAAYDHKLTGLLTDEVYRNLYQQTQHYMTRMYSAQDWEEQFGTDPNGIKKLLWLASSGTEVNLIRFSLILFFLLFFKYSSLCARYP
jgi:hypothetical protein